jgi:hypothetical protein
MLFLTARQLCELRWRREPGFAFERPGLRHPEKQRIVSDANTPNNVLTVHS